MTKQELRKIFKEKRSALSKEMVAKKSQLVAENFINNLLPVIYQKKIHQTFSLYLASRGEVATDGLAQHFKKNHIKFSYPKIIALKQPLEFIAHQENQKFSPNSFYPQISEPQEGERISPDFLILPLLAFDSNLSRLGMGGGFFDRTIYYLKTIKPRIITIGLAYDFQRAEELLPIENTDQRLDFIVTEKDVIFK